METGRKAVVLSSGGLDSTTVMAIALEEGFEVYSLTVDYGQRHRVELEAARKVASVLGAEEHKVLRVDLAGIGGSALTENLRVPKGRQEDQMPNEIPITYVPARNTVFLSLALGWAEVLGSAHIFIGANSIDYSGYPDCRPEYLTAFEKLALLATKAGVEGRLKIRILAPLLHMAKREIILKGLELGVDYSLTHSCYDPLPDGRACGECDSCRLRKKGFREAGIQDPSER